jgi:hypothetical protein
MIIQVSKYISFVVFTQVGVFFPKARTAFFPSWMVLCDFILLIIQGSPPILEWMIDHPEMTILPSVSFVN